MDISALIESVGREPRSVGADAGLFSVKFGGRLLLSDGSVLDPAREIGSPFGYVFLSDCLLSPGVCPGGVR